MGTKQRPFTRLANLSFILILLLAAVGTGCSAATSPAPQGNTATPTESAIESTPTPADENQPATPVPTNTPVLISTKTSAPRPEPVQVEESTQEENPGNEIDFGTADLAIIRPGQLSRHTSPIRIIANLDSDQVKETTITLFGEDGRVLATKTLWSKPYLDPINGNIITDIEFSISGLVETGRLELKAVDEFGRLWALNSVYLILLSQGITDRNYAPENQDRILLQLPFPGEREISSSPIFISGVVRTTSESPLNIWLVDEAGNTVGEGQASVVFTPGSPYGQFVGEIPYQVPGPTRVLMTIAMQEGRIPGMTYLKTIEFNLLQ